MTFALRGQLEQVFDLRVRSGLNAFAKIIAAFDVSGDTKKFAQKMRLTPRGLIKTPLELWKRLLAPPGIWRTDPQAFGIPAATQIFGRFVRDAGFEAILYPSQQGGTSCLAVFPENLERAAGRSRSSVQSRPVRAARSSTKIIFAWTVSFDYEVSPGGTARVWCPEGDKR